MEDVTLWQQIMANRTLVWLFTAFIVFVGFALRPGTRKIHRDSANIPFRHEDKPSSDQLENAAQKEART